MSSETTTVKFMGEDVVVPKTVIYDISKTLDENLSAAGVDPAEFEKLFEQWSAGQIASEMGMEVKQMGGGKELAQILIGMTLCASGALVGAKLYLDTLATIPGKEAFSASVCTRDPGSWYPLRWSVEVNSSLCLGARNDVNEVVGKALTWAMGFGGPLCAFGFTTIVSATGGDAEKFAANMSDAFKMMQSAFRSIHKEKAAEARRTIRVLEEVDRQRGEATQAALENIGDTFARGAAAAAAVAAAAPGGPGAMAATAATVLPSAALGAVTEQTKRANELRIVQNERARAAVAPEDVPETAEEREARETTDQRKERKEREDRERKERERNAAPARGGAVPSPQMVRLGLIMNGVMPEVADKVITHVKGGRRRSRSFKKSRRAGRARHTRRK